MDFQVTYIAHMKGKSAAVLCFAILVFLNKYNNKHQMENLVVHMVIQPTPSESFLQAPFRGNLNPLQEGFNSQMNKVRVSVEWLFNGIIKYFEFLDF